MPGTLPIKFSYLTQDDVIQLTNPQNFYFVETAVGVEGHGLARFGSNCYLTPINSKLDDQCYLEVYHLKIIDCCIKAHLLYTCTHARTHAHTHTLTD